ncbi:response regulator transcription factor [Actinomadura montaniterrae]|uniref:Response regulator transcription factor n=1 Tax=Actinomadura montaniterrae TaxID=1803903 RepID=A0A6L3W208_9ACTN|nr:response regulator transcription factor [Actinomadura montaniterrae]KAB2381566.1 response regulator transcription factor [Actinomadura montaniterrae]
MIRVLLAEDQGMMRDALVLLLNLEEDLEVVAETDRGDDVVPRALETRPDVAVVDIELPGRSGLDVITDLHERLPTCRVLIVTTFGRPGYVRRAMDAGAAGFLVKDSPGHELAGAIRRVLAGERVIDPELATTALAVGPNPLTERELEVLAAADHGATAADIAELLSLSENTVRNYLSGIIQKTGARNRIEAIQKARRNGWF